MKEVWRVMRPGAHGFVWALPRRAHWTALALEDANFEIRDKVYHLYCNGFPKGNNISKTIDKKLGLEREVVGVSENRFNRDVAGASAGGGIYAGPPKDIPITTPNSDLAKQWDGWNTQLKSAVEEYFLIRKPLSEKTIVDNVLKWGTGALNIDACRVGENGGTSMNHSKVKVNNPYGNVNRGHDRLSCDVKPIDKGRYPANFIHDGSPEVLEELAQWGNSKSQNNDKGKCGGYKEGWGDEFRTASEYGDTRYRHRKGNLMRGYDDEDSIARFFYNTGNVFYCAKASTAERNRGLDDLPDVSAADRSGRKEGSAGVRSVAVGDSKNFHPCVKPIKLMQWLITLITPPQGHVLDCFMGSGSTGVAAKSLGFDFTGVELEKDYFEIARRRIGD